MAAGPEKQLGLLPHISDIQEQGSAAKRAIDRVVGTDVRPRVEALAALDAPKDDG